MYYTPMEFSPKKQQLEYIRANDLVLEAVSAIWNTNRDFRGGGTRKRSGKYENGTGKTQECTCTGVAHT